MQSIFAKNGLETPEPVTAQVEGEFEREVEIIYRVNKLIMLRC